MANLVEVVNHTKRPFMAEGGRCWPLKTQTVSSKWWARMRERLQKVLCRAEDLEEELQDSKKRKLLMLCSALGIEKSSERDELVGRLLTYHKTGSVEEASDFELEIEEDPEEDEKSGDENTPQIDDDVDPGEILPEDWKGVEEESWARLKSVAYEYRNTFCPDHEFEKQDKPSFKNFLKGCGFDD